jgi:anti-sigma B factor antagonist
MQLKLGTHTVDGIQVLDCNGRIVFGEETALLRDTVKEMMAAYKSLVLNLGGVTYIDSGGLGMLVSVYVSARNAGASIKLARVTQRVGDVLQVTKLLTVFDTYETEEQAVKSFKTAA